MNTDQGLADLHAALSFKPLSWRWAKLEIAIGLFAAGAGLFGGQWVFSWAREVNWPAAAGSLALFVLGGYLALAGHRSHLYQSNNALAAYLAEQIRSNGISTGDPGRRAGGRQ